MAQVEKPTRGRASKVDLLPPNIKTQLAMMLRDKQFSQAEILAEINDLIADCGLDESFQLSRTGLNRYASRMEKMASRIRQSREIAEVWTKQLGEQPQSDIGKLLMELVKNIAFESTLKMGEDGAQIEIGELKELSIIAHRLEQAQAISEDRERKIRKDVIEQAARAVEEAGTQAGAKLEDIAKMVKAVYGIE